MIAWFLDSKLVYSVYTCKDLQPCTVVVKCNSYKMYILLKMALPFWPQIRSIKQKMCRWTQRSIKTRHSYTHPIPDTMSGCT